MLLPGGTQGQKAPVQWGLDASPPTPCAAWVAGSHLLWVGGWRPGDDASHNSPPHPKQSTLLELGQSVGRRQGRGPGERGAAGTVSPGNLVTAAPWAAGGGGKRGSEHRTCLGSMTCQDTEIMFQFIDEHRLVPSVPQGQTGPKD